MSTLTLAQSSKVSDVVRRAAPDPRFEMHQVQSNGHRSLHAREAFTAGQVLASFKTSQKVATPSYLTVQVGEDDHILLSPSHLELINHSCEPNVFFDVETTELKALRDIEAGEELGFFYPSTEWQMSQPFRCHCQSDSCLEMIQGAAYISEDILARYDLNPHIRELVRQSSVVAL